MKKNVLCILFFAMLIISSCKKDNYNNPAVASLTLINAVTGGNSVKLGSRAITIANNSTFQLAVNVEGEDLYIWPVGDSTHPYYTYAKFNPFDREVYSLFLGGTATAVDGILIKEDIPYRTDSTGGIRFINLSPNSPPLNISLVTTPSINEVSNLAYKQYTEFRTYPALTSTIPYSFQIKNASTGAVVLTASANPIPRFSNITLVLRGIVGGSGTQALGITRVAQDR
jgi:hypothetical protein